MKVNLDVYRGCSSRGSSKILDCKMLKDLLKYGVHNVCVPNSSCPWNVFIQALPWGLQETWKEESVFL